ncbi:glutamate-rich protein 1 [Nerophis ophidion]|uniref:glutamate-rich protein 1 n=1 Tax=Nerophis ophidion TaxID=159077 RepID=UPI002ADF1326|nr:glutamate-rich protein 1 [Nerophis ophidion]
MPANMAHRKEVFQSKVLQKLYPATPKSDKEPSSACTVAAVAPTICTKRKASHSHGNIEMTPSVIKTMRMYTVIPPPADYNADPGKTVTLLQHENIMEASSEHDIQELSEKPDQDVEADEQKKRRKRRKKRLNLKGDLCTDEVAPIKDSRIGQNEMPADEEAVLVSRNKKRKLKKKRHKEKLLSMGLMPRASALEFTYQKQKEDGRGCEDSC